MLSTFNEPKVKEKKFINIELSLTLDKSRRSRYMINNFFAEHILDTFPIDKISSIGRKFFIVCFGGLWYRFSWHVGISYGFALVRAVDLSSP